jgi:hypothetical protein
MRTQAEIERLLVDAALVLKAGTTDAPKELTGMAVALAWVVADVEPKMESVASVRERARDLRRFEAELN